MPATVRQEDAPSFSSLPQELRDEILSKTNLVVRDHPGRWGSGLLIRNGQITSATANNTCIHDPKCDCTEVPKALLSKTNPGLRRQALEVLLSCNLIVLDGDFSLSLEWLKEQGDLVRKIRALDLQIGVEQGEEWNEEGSEYPAEWQELITFIENNLNLSNLTLSIDHGLCYEYYEQRGVTEASLGNVLDAYRQIVKPLRPLGQKGLKEFYVFWACFHQNEAEAEKYVMGEAYAPAGKVPHTKRNPYFPHGAPFERFENPNGMSLDST
jgi:hypothetical protein